MAVNAITTLFENVLFHRLCLYVRKVLHQFTKLRNSVIFGNGNEEYDGALKPGSCSATSHVF